MNITLARLIKLSIIAAIALPIVAGVIVTLSMAFGYFPALGGHSCTFENFVALSKLPGFWHALWRTASIGIIATALSLVIVYLSLVFVLSRERFLGWFRQFCAPLLAIPHVTVSLGVIYLFSTSGTLGRILYHVFDMPVDYSFAPDGSGFSMILALVIKEVPYLLLMSLGVLAQINTRKSVITARSLGYSVPAAWAKIVIPQVHKQITLPVLIVLSFSLTSPEHNLLLLPRYASGLPTLIIDLYNHPDLHFQFIASACVAVLILVCIISLIAWYTFSRILQRLLHFFFIANGKRHLTCEAVLQKTCPIFICLIFFINFASLVVMMIWSVTHSWFYPNLLPSSLSLKYWMQTYGYSEATVSTLVIAFASIVVTLILSITYLEISPPEPLTHANKSANRPPRKGQTKIAATVFTSLIYLPLITPQIAFVFGLKFLLSLFDYSILLLFIAVVWGHVLFVFPYHFLSLVSPYQHFDARYMIIARCLGRSQLYATFKIKWPILKAPILFACAIGTTVSFSLYLPTLVLGGGRFHTLTVETIAIASGGNLRAIAIFTCLQTFLSFLVFAWAILWSRKNPAYFTTSRKV